ncbi:hypothetical protein ACFLU5_07070 [Bacteroidota bacterium]
MDKKFRTYLRCYFLTILLLGCFKIYGQVKLDGILDLPIGQVERIFHIITADKNGLILYRETTELEETTVRTWEILLLNTELEVQWSTSLKSEYSFQLNSICADEISFYLLFKNQSSSKKEIKIYQIDFSSKNFVVIPVKTFVPKKINYFKVVSNTIVLGGSEKGKPAIVFYPKLSDRPVILQGIFGKKGKVLDIFHDSENNICTILYQYRNIDGNWSVAVKSYDYTGKIIEDTNIEPDGLVQIKDARTRISGDRRIVAGTYYRRGNSAVNGYFSAVISPHGTYDLELFPLNTLNVKDISLSDTTYNIADSVVEKRIPDKYEHMLVRELQTHNGQLLLLTETMNPNDLNSKAREKSGGKVRFIKGAISSFNRKGALLWHNEYMMSGYYSELYPSLTKMEGRNDTIITFIYYRKSIAEQKLFDGELVSGYSYTDLELMDFYDEFDKESLNVHNEIRAWYGSHYLFISMMKDPETFENLTMLSLRKLKIE